MRIRNRLLWMGTCLGVILLAVTAASAQEMTAQPGTNMAQQKFTTLPPLPTCGRGAVASGDPTKGASVILAKATAGCVFPWHWHTPNEHVMIVSGSASLQVKDGKAVTLNSGAFALMPSHHVHQFKCLRACVLFIYSDSAFDMHYVDKAGNEITPDAALKAYREKPATEMK